MAEPGVVAAVLTVVLGAVPEEVTESISPATSLISRAMRARSWLILAIILEKKFNSFTQQVYKQSLQYNQFYKLYSINHLEKTCKFEKKNNKAV